MRYIISILIFLISGCCHLNTKNMTMWGVGEAKVDEEGNLREMKCGIFSFPKLEVNQ